jgi:hypothetical protein
MSIPLDQLYHYINQCAQESWGDRVIIYRFYPHGSKDLKNLSFLDDYDHDQNIIVCPHVFCNDQEPLDFERYETESFHSQPTQETIASNGMSKMNLRDYPENIWDYAVLLHSEQRSENLTQYANSAFIPAYYWSHAIIARDWFRYAEHVEQHKQVDRTFLIYNRAWAGTREYRLRFAEFLIRLDLIDDCRTSVNPVEPELGIHYECHRFKNPTWRPNTVLENFFPVSDAHSHYSANFDIKDYEATDIEIVLETLFDDERLHLTEKSLRPIACGQPFILAGTHGSLKYLRSYGFKTFMHVWDERYDLIVDPEERLIAIADLMKQITNWAPWVRERKMAEARAIAEYNRQHFFSKDFFNLIVNELTTNLDQAFAQLRQVNTCQRWLNVYTPKNKIQITGSMLDRLDSERQQQILKQAQLLNLKNM